MSLLKPMASAIGLAVLVASGTVVPSPASAETRILACEPEWAALAAEIGGEAVHVSSATHGRQDPHYVRARPSLIAQARRADLLLCAGSGLEEGWLPVLLQRGARVTVQPGQPGYLMASDHVRLLDVPGHADRGLGHVHPLGNPHVHLLPQNIAVVAAELARRLALIDPDNAKTYWDRLSAFQERWKNATARWKERAARLAGMPIITYHEAWTYLFAWTGIEEVASIERIPGVPPTAAHLQEVLERTRDGGARAILRAPYETSAGIEWLADKAGIPIVDLPFTVGGREGVDDLFDLFDDTLTQLEAVRDQS